MNNLPSPPKRGEWGVQKMPPYGGTFGFDRKTVSKVVRADRHATVVLGALHGHRQSLLERSGCGLREIAGGHHALLLEEVLDRRCYDVTHRDGEKKIKTEGL